MKKLYPAIFFLAIASAAPLTATAGTRVDVNIGLPPIVIGGPPVVVEVPDTDEVYVAPDVNVDLYFWSGWWWRPYEGRWYRSHYYDHGWVYYQSVPRFYHHVDPHWRAYYRDHNWHGHHWDYRRIPGGQFHGNHGGHGGHGSHGYYEQQGHQGRHGGH